MKPHDLSSRYQPDLDAELRSVVGDSSLPLYHMMRYHLGWVDASGRSRIAKRGKLLRPSLCLLSCESVGGNWRAALPAAAALELVHNFSLIHDDIEDGDHERRGVPTVWHVWGLPQGVNAGDAMHVLARIALLRLEGKGIAAGKIVRTARLLDEACLRLCEGQYLDISYEDRFDIGIEDYLEMIAGKTAALFSCSLKIGALLGTDDAQVVEHMAGFGRNLGLAFQIQDDILGIWGDEGTTGKSSASDIMKKKKTLPVIYGIQQAGPEQRDELLRIYGQEKVQNKEAHAVVAILNRLDARKYARGVAEEYYKKSIFCLDETSIPASSKRDLRDLAEFMIKREY